MSTQREEIDPLGGPDDAYAEMERKLAPGDVGFVFQVGDSADVWAWGVWSKAEALDVLDAIGDDARELRSDVAGGEPAGRLLVLLFRADGTIELGALARAAALASSPAPEAA